MTDGCNLSAYTAVIAHVSRLVLCDDHPRKPSHVLPKVVRAVRRCFGRLMNLGGSLARHSGSPLLKTLSVTFSTLNGLSNMMNVARRSCLPRTSRALLEGPLGTLSSRACLPSQGLRMTN